MNLLIRGECQGILEIDVFRKVADEIGDFMEEEGYSKIKDMVGVAHD